MSSPLQRTLVPTPDGHIHVRAAGAGDAVILMHWTPSSSRQYVPIIHALADAGYRAIAPDHMGFGYSDPRPRPWTMHDFADNIAATLKQMSIARAHIVGGHVSSEIAVELATRHPSLVRTVVLDGSPVWSRERREAVLATARPEPPAWNEDGDHIAWAWQRTVWLQRMWDTNFALTASTAEDMRAALIDSLLSGHQSDTAEALKAYDMDLVLPRLRVPVLALTAETDPLYNCHAEVLRLVPHARGHVFRGSHPLHHPDRAAEYAGVLHDFFTSTGA
jgi:pimeloyl-ACP methyl ester carboxylesterase